MIIFYIGSSNPPRANEETMFVLDELAAECGAELVANPTCQRDPRIYAARIKRNVANQIRKANAVANNILRLENAAHIEELEDKYFDARDAFDNANAEYHRMLRNNPRLFPEDCDGMVSQCSRRLNKARTLLESARNQAKNRVADYLSKINITITTDKDSDEEARN